MDTEHAQGSAAHWRRPAPGMGYRSTKTYGHEIGLSACFRQWRAHSHCRHLHGYALAVKFIFGTRELDPTNWVVDFGGLKQLKHMLEATFDHTLLVAEDDPYAPDLKRLADLDLARVIMVPATGCEAFARLIFEVTETWLKDAGFHHAILISVEVREHGANSAIYQRVPS